MRLFNQLAEFSKEDLLPLAKEALDDLRVAGRDVEVGFRKGMAHLWPNWQETHPEGWQKWQGWWGRSVQRLHIHGERFLIQLDRAARRTEAWVVRVTERAEGRFNQKKPLFLQKWQRIKEWLFRSSIAIEEIVHSVEEPLPLPEREKQLPHQES